MARKKRGDVSAAAQGSAQPVAATNAPEAVVGNSPVAKPNGTPTASPLGRGQDNGVVQEVSPKAASSPMAATLAAAAVVTARPQVDTSNMSASQKKNLKKKMRKQEQRQQEAAMMAAVRVDGVVNSANHYAEQEAALRRRLDAIKRSASQPRHENRGGGGGGVKKMVHELETLLRDCDSVMEREAVALQKPVSKRLTVAQLQQQVRDVEMQVQKQQKELQKLANQSPQHQQEKGEEWPAQSALEESLRYLAHLREQLMLTQQQSDLRGFQDRVGALKSECEAFLKSMSSVGSGRGGGASNAVAVNGSPREAQWRRRLAGLNGGRGGGSGAAGRKGGNRGAVSGGEEGHGDQVEALPALLTQQVALGADAMSLLFPGGQNPLLVRKIERGSGAIIDRQSGGGGRAGTVLIVGLQSPSVERCAAVLSSLDEGMQPDKKEKYRVSVSGARSVGSVIGAGGSNLRKIEEDCDVIVFAEGTEMIVMGASPANIAKGLQQLKVGLRRRSDR